MIIHALAVVSWLVGQQSPASGADVNTLLISLIGSSPLAGVCAYWAYSERSDRRAIDKQLAFERTQHAAEIKLLHETNLATLERLLPLINDSTATLKEVNESMSLEVAAARRRAATPELERRLDELTDLLRGSR